MRFRASRRLCGAALAGTLLFAGLASQARAEETSPCFTGDGSIKEVLDSCAAYIASGSTDKDKLITAHSVRAMAFSAVRDLDSAIAEMDEAVKIDATKPNSVFHARRGLRGQEGLRQGHRRSRRGHQARCRATATISCCAASSTGTRAISTGRLSSSTRR